MPSARRRPIPRQPTIPARSTGHALPAAASATTTVVEDYLKAIYSHTEWQSVPISSTQLAGRLGLAPSSVTEMVKKLVSTGLVDHAPYGAIELTASGLDQAIRMVRRHRVVETWLVERFGYGWDEVHDEAEVLEHAISDRLLDAMDEQLGRPERDPHGDPIPRADGSVPRPDGVLLSELPRGASSRVVRVSDRDPELLREFTGAGLDLDREVTAGELSAEVEAVVWVTPLAHRARA